MQIVDGGYGSATGGTPLERDPGHGGLPVGAAAGETLRYSFIRMTGEGTTLRLALDGAATNVGSEIASIDACTVTDEAWTAERGEPMAEAPQVGGSCVAGERLPDGTWRFDLASIDGGAGREGGIALVPSAAAAGQTFEIVFAPFAIGS